MANTLDTRRTPVAENIHQSYKMKQNIAIFIITISLLLYPNHDLFNFILNSTPLSPWKQFLALVFYAPIISWLLKNSRISKIDKIKKNLLLSYAFLGYIYILYSLIIGMSLFRALYGLLAYSGLASFLYYSSFLKSIDYRTKIYLTASYISAFCSFGLIFDYFTDFLKFLPRSEGLTNDYYEIYEATKRSAFFFGASTLTFQVQSFGLLSTALVLSKFNSIKSYILFILTSTLNLYGIYLTGSRTSFYLLILIFLTGLHIAGLKLNSQKRFLLIIIILPMLLPIYYFGIYNLNLERFIYVFSAQDDGNLNRFKFWTDGLTLMTDITPEWFLGHGLGSTLGNVNDGLTAGPHYESSVFQAFYEGGLGLIFYRYLAAIIALKIYISQFKFRSNETTALAILLMSITLSTFVAPTFGAFHNQLIYFLVAGLLITLSTKNLDQLTKN